MFGQTLHPEQIHRIKKEQMQSFKNFESTAPTLSDPSFGQP